MKKKKKKNNSVEVETVELGSFKYCQVSKLKIASGASASAAMDHIPSMVWGILIGSSGLRRTYRDCDARYDPSSTDYRTILCRINLFGNTVPGPNVLISNEVITFRCPLLWNTIWKFLFEIHCKSKLSCMDPYARNGIILFSKQGKTVHGLFDFRRDGTKRCCFIYRLRSLRDVSRLLNLLAALFRYRERSPSVAYLSHLYHCFFLYSYSTTLVVPSKRYANFWKRNVPRTKKQRWKRSRNCCFIFIVC